MPPELSTDPNPTDDGAGAQARRLKFEQRAHAYARDRGLSAPVYVTVLTLAKILLRLWFRVRIYDRELIPASGPAIIAPNHKNFFDVFFVGMATRRRLRYMAKIELFKGPVGWLLLRVGAFPVRRGDADSEAIETAVQILAGGGLVVMFPEGTRVEQPDALGFPHHGAGRLALQSGAPIILAAIMGTSHLWRGAIPQTKRVQLALLAPIETVPGGHDAAQLIDELVWPAVQEGYGSLRARPGLIAACVAAIGIGGGLLAKRRHAIRGKPDLLGTVQPRKLRRRGRRRER